MSTHKLPAIVLALGLGSGAAFAAGPNLGTPIEPGEIAPWDISIQPDGTGLPMGGGTPAQGARIFAQKCALCHGENGKGGPFAALVGGAPLASGIDTPKTRQQPRSLTDNEVYALTAYILAENKLIGENDSMNPETLPKVRMPNRDGFIIRFPDKI
ncbi:MAG: cytochrome c [Betaproteobacteria bacterium]|nr:MAG: cytochrome c [Betaproteobacteria bacterium]